MGNYPRANPKQEKIQLLVAVISLCSCLVLGNGGYGVASEPPPLLQIQGERITGVLNQVPLRTVLAQLQQKLSIEYVVPRGELDKPVSANLTGDPVVKALSKILASWDYALQQDHQGKVHQIFVVAKIGLIEAEKNTVKAFESKMATLPRKMPRSESVLSLPKTQALLPEAELTSGSEKDPTVSPMVIEPDNIPPMVIQPSQSGPMPIQPSSNFMQVIPASGYSKMDILPVSEEAGREFLEGQN